MTSYGCQNTESFKLRLVCKLNYGFDMELQAVAEKEAEKNLLHKKQKIDSEIYFFKKKSNISRKTWFIFLSVLCLI